ncbi:MAG: hypothetical protein AAGJ93_09760 [Bacteroidota bacterium]
MDHIKRYGQNLLGPRTKRKILIIESDDWGSIRMPSSEVYRHLATKPYQVEKDPYLKYDSLASNDDLTALFEVLSSVQDKQGNAAKITANCVVANPDFEAIRAANFKAYSYEDFRATLARYPRHDKAFAYWQEGMEKQLFQPQFHGREHINIYQWMQALQQGDPLLHEAFDHQMISISSVPCKMTFGYMEGLDYFSEEEKTTKSEVLEDGLRLFEAAFGYTSKSFIANCYVWDSDLESVLKTHGVDFIQGIIKQLIPDLNSEDHAYQYRYHYMGQKNKLGQRYLIRNVFFEPSMEPQKDWLTEVIARIDVAFRLGKPAIIGSHRLNYIGHIDEENRTKNLKLLKELLQQIVTKWPDVEFKSTDQLEEVYRNT